MASSNYPILLNGSEQQREAFHVGSAFYPEFYSSASNAGALDVSRALGSARSAWRPPLQQRAEILEMAAASFTFRTSDLEASVRMTGMPVTQVEALYRQIPTLLGMPGKSLVSRFRMAGGQDPVLLEQLAPGDFKIISPGAGFCYAITPGSDPRAAALVAANLVALGIPFILRASPRDPAAPLTIRALYEAGLDPAFCSLLYLDPSAPDTAQKHFKLVDACSAVWTFGPAADIDPTLRYERSLPTARLDLSGILEPGMTPDMLQDRLSEGGGQGIIHRLVVEETAVDHFEGKLVLRHASGNCAAISWGELDEASWQVVDRSLAYPVVCTALKSVMAVGGPDWAGQAAARLAEKVIGDPLDPRTEIGFISPRHLDRLQRLVEANTGRVKASGGKRLSAQQAEPLLVYSEVDAPDFFGQEIPAYVLAVRPCTDLAEAVARLNGTGLDPRLAVSLLGLPAQYRLEVGRSLKAHTVLVDRPTSEVFPVLHEGNDYALALSQTTLLRT